MSRLQIVMSKEIGGWPLYTIVIAMGQVRVSVIYVFPPAYSLYLTDVERNELPNDSSDRTELPVEQSALHPRCYCLRWDCSLVPTVPHETVDSCSVSSLDVLWIGIFPGRTAICREPTS